MQYHPDDFLRLEEGIETVGGTRAAGTCLPQRIKYRYRTGGGKARTHEHMTSGCGNESRFLIPYRKPNAARSDTMEDNQGLATVCAVDDDMGKWPRFAHLMQEDSN